jgi:hypothetical protein
MMAVMLCVILNGVAAAHDLASERGMLRNSLADTEECGHRTMGRKQVEHTGRHFGVRPVIDRERNLRASGRSLWQSRPVRS